MARPPEEDTFYDFFKAKYTTQYLEEYVDDHSFAVQSLRERIKFGFNVERIRKIDGEWVVSGKCKAEKSEIYRTPELIVASGLTSTPKPPNLPYRERSEGLVMHQEDLGQSAILSSSEIQHVTVLGGSKSAADMVYVAVKAGKSVSWIIRTPGTGPDWSGLVPSSKGHRPI